MPTTQKKPTVKELSKRLQELELAIARQDIWINAIDKIAGGLAHLHEDMSVEDIRKQYAKVKKAKEDGKEIMVNKLQKGFEDEKVQEKK